MTGKNFKFELSVMSIMLSLALIFSLVAVVLPAKPIKAAVTEVTVDNVTGPKTSNPAYVAPGGSIYVSGNITDDGSHGSSCNFNIRIEVYSGSTIIGDSGILVRSLTCNGEPQPFGPETVSISAAAAAGTYNVRVTAQNQSGGGAVSGTMTGGVIVDRTPPTATITYPNGAEVLKGNTSYNILWNDNDNYTTNEGWTLQYSIDNGVTWNDCLPHTIGSGNFGSHSVAWTTPAATNSQVCKVRVTVTDIAGNQVVDESNATFTIDSTAPTVTLTSFNSGGTFDAGDVQNITWNAIDTLPGNLNYVLEYSVDNGANWVSIINLTNQPQGNRTYAWTLPGANSSQCKVRVKATDAAGNSSIATSAVNFTIQDTTPPTVTLLAPNGGESWAAGSSQTIRWTATDNVPGNNMRYDLFYCTNYGSGDSWSLITSLTSQPQGARTYTWNPVPTPLGGATSSTCRVKIEAYDVANNLTTKTSASNFTITVDTTPPTVTLISPVGTESWEGGTVHDITWTANDNTTTDKLSVTIEYSTDSGTTYNTIAKLRGVAQGTGSFSWAVPDTRSTTCLVKITVKDQSGNQTIKISPNVFAITSATCAVQTASEELPAGWSLISLPVIPVCTNIESVLGPILDKVEAVWYYTGGASGTWKSYAPGLPSPTLTTMEAGKAYWVKLSGSADLTVTGRKWVCPGVTPPTYSYVAGWNLVGYKSLITKTVSDYLPQNQAQHSQPISGCWDGTGFTKSDTEYMEQWRGYWVFFTGAGPWTAAIADD